MTKMKTTNRRDEQTLVQRAFDLLIMCEQIVAAEPFDQLRYKRANAELRRLLRTLKLDRRQIETMLDVSDYMRSRRPAPH